MRLTEKSYAIGLAKEDRYNLLKEKNEEIARLIQFMTEYSLKPEYINSVLEVLETSPLKHGIKLKDLITRPQITIENICEHIPAFKAELDKIPNRKDEIIEASEIKIKYDGYIKREEIIAEKINRLENIKIKDRFNYDSIVSLSTEAREKLKKINPETIAQAGRIPGISPNDISILLVLLGR
jgi:tRNA uridine 5-carboxymethylaminomethyl modification enzyme